MATHETYVLAVFAPQPESCLMVYDQRPSWSPSEQNWREREMRHARERKAPCGAFPLPSTSEVPSATPEPVANIVTAWSEEPRTERRSAISNHRRSIHRRCIDRIFLNDDAGSSNDDGPANHHGFPDHGSINKSWRNVEARSGFAIRLTWIGHAIAIYRQISG